MKQQKMYGLKLSDELHAELAALKKTSSAALANFMREQLKHFIEREEYLSKMYADDKDEQSVSTTQNTEVS